MTGLLQDDSDDDNSTLVPSTLISQWCLGFYDYEGSDTDTHMGGDVGGYMSATKDGGKSVTPRVERLFQLEGTSDIPIISWFGNVYMFYSTALFVKEMGTETPQLFTHRPLIDIAATVLLGLKYTPRNACLIFLYIGVV